MSKSSFHLASICMWLALATLALKPFSRLSEVPLLLLAIIGLVTLLRHRREVFALPAVRLLLAVFLCYWIPMLWASPFAWDVERSLITTAAVLRFPLAGVALAWAWRFDSRRWLGNLALGVAFLLSFWLLDALWQMISGSNFFGDPRAERLNGVFGAGNLKLGPMLVLLLAPAVLAVLSRGWNSLAGLLYFAVGGLILVIGTRSAWVMFALVSLMLLWPMLHSQPRKGLAVGAGVAAVMILIGGLAFQYSEDFRQRLERTAQVLEADADGVDSALSTRLPIWQTAWNMGSDNPVTGVGPRGFRYAYAEYAAPDDPWVAHPDYIGAYHAHHIVLEAFSETGIPGVLGLLLGTWLLLSAWQTLPTEQRRAAMPWLLSLVAITFPLNTHYAIYSTDWSMTLWWFALMAIVALGTPTQWAKQHQS